MRYEGFPGALDLQEDLKKTLRLWGLSLDQLHQRTRAIWAAGYRPGADAAPRPWALVLIRPIRTVLESRSC